MCINSPSEKKKGGGGEKTVGSDGWFPALGR